MAATRVSAQSVGDIAIERTQEERVLTPESGVNAAT
jgi:hypothetical protein